MDNVWNEYFLLSYLKESELEEKYREEKLDFLHILY